MTILNEKEVYFNRKKVMLLILTLPIIPILVAFTYDKLLEKATFMEYFSFGVVLAMHPVFFYGLLKMFLAKTPALILTQEGVISNTRMLNLKKGATSRFIPWSDIKSIKLVSRSNSKYISIQLNHTGFMNKIFKGAVGVPSFLLDIKQDVLFEMLKTYHEKSKHSKKVTGDNQSAIEYL